MFFLYYIQNLINDKLYIGKTSNFSKRKSRHLRNSHNVLLRRAVEKYGRENFSFEVFQCFDTEDEAYLAEEEWTARLQEFGCELYNTSAGGRGGYAGTKRSNEVKKIVSDKLKGKLKSKETKKRMSLSKIGKPLSEAHKQKLRKPKSEQTKLRMLLAQRLRVQKTKTPGLP